MIHRWKNPLGAPTTERLLMVFGLLSSLALAIWATVHFHYGLAGFFRAFFGGLVGWALIALLVILGLGAADLLFHEAGMRRAREARRKRVRRRRNPPPNSPK